MQDVIESKLQIEKKIKSCNLSLSLIVEANTHLKDALNNLTVESNTKGVEEQLKT